MKKRITMMLVLILILSLCAVPALAYSATASVPNQGDVSADFTNDSMRAVSVARAIALTVNGVTYSIPGGATSTVGTGYNNAYTYVYYCQLACNWLYDYHLDSIALPCYSYCGTVDGAFGPNTHNGIKGFQYWNNHRMAGWPQIAEDGICGDATWTRLASQCG